MPVRAERILFLAALALSALARPARAEPKPKPAPSEEVAEALAPADGGYLHLMGALSIGRGIRFNNPYRLATPLGKSPESLSLTESYADLAVTGALGDPDGLQHGVSIHMSAALAGVPQEVLTPSYAALYRLPPRYWVWGRAGLPIVVEPDANVGYELAVGGAWLATASLGATAELVGDLFYGAATQDKAVTAIPIVSLQLGIVADIEVLP